MESLIIGENGPSFCIESNATHQHNALFWLKSSVKVRFYLKNWWLSLVPEQNFVKSDDCTPFLSRISWILMIVPSSWAEFHEFWWLYPVPEQNFMKSDDCTRVFYQNYAIFGNCPRVFCRKLANSVHFPRVFCRKIAISDHLPQVFCRKLAISAHLPRVICRNIMISGFQQAYKM